MFKNPFIIVGIPLLLLFITGLGYLGYIRYSADMSRYDTQNQLLIQEKEVLSHRLDFLEYENTQNNTYLTYSGVLHYIAIDGIVGSGVLITESYDAVRFHNITQSPVVLDIYDSPDTTITPITHLDIASGSVSSFALKKSGVYTYVFGEQKGTIIIGREYLEQYNLSSFLEKEIFSIFDRGDALSIGKGLLRFKEISMTNALISKNCHNLAHDIGYEAFELYGFAVAIAGGADDICAGGYTHGVLESYFQSAPQLASDPEFACSTIPDDKKGSCFHGVGHGLMFISANNIDTALAGCHMLSTSVYQNRCAEGVFMELYSGDPKHAMGKIGYSTGELFAPCNNYGTGSEGYVCGFYAGLGYLRYMSEDYEGALAACSAGGRYADMCVRGVGKEIGKRYIGDALKLETTCGTLTNTTAQHNCLNGGISYTRLQFEDDIDVIAGYCRGFQTFGALCGSTNTGESLLTGSGTSI